MSVGELICECRTLSLSAQGLSAHGRTQRVNTLPQAKTGMTPCHSKAPQRHLHWRILNPTIQLQAPACLKISRQGNPGGRREIIWARCRMAGWHHVSSDDFGALSRGLVSMRDLGHIQGPHKDLPAPVPCGELRW